MDKDADPAGETGTRFFGKISATVSHEIKNGLAVINENAGLLKDLILMAEKGRPLDPRRIGAIADKVLERVAKADDVVRNLNLFAHKVDDPVASVDLFENFTLITQLTGRIAANRAKNITIIAPESPVRITTNPFMLLNLSWCCLEAAMDGAPEKHELTVDIKQHSGEAEIRVGQVDDAEMISRKFAGETEMLLTTRLGAGMTVEGGAIVLRLPEKMDMA